MGLRRGEICQVLLKDPTLGSTKVPIGSQVACSLPAPHQVGLASVGPRPRVHTDRPRGLGPSCCSANAWLEPSEEEVAAASNKRCFLFPAWE